MNHMLPVPQKTDTSFPHEGERSVVVEQQKLSSMMKKYIMVLTENYPFTKDIKLDKRRGMADIAAAWPKIPGWEAQAKEMVEYIRDIIDAIPTVEPMPGILLRISISPSRLTPVAFPEPQESAVIATFDAVKGVLRRCTFTGCEEPPRLDDIAVAAGIMMICQPLPPFINQFSDRYPKSLRPIRIEYNEDRDLVGGAENAPYMIPPVDVSAPHRPTALKDPMHAAKTAAEVAVVGGIFAASETKSAEQQPEEEAPLYPETDRRFKKRGLSELSDSLPYETTGESILAEEALENPVEPQIYPETDRRFKKRGVSEWSDFRPYETTGEALLAEQVVTTEAEVMKTNQQEEQVMEHALLQEKQTQEQGVIQERGVIEEARRQEEQQRQESERLEKTRLENERIESVRRGRERSEEETRRRERRREAREREQYLRETETKLQSHQYEQEEVLKQRTEASSTGDLVEGSIVVPLHGGQPPQGGVGLSEVIVGGMAEYHGTTNEGVVEREDRESMSEREKESSHTSQHAHVHVYGHEQSGSKSGFMSEAVLHMVMAHGAAGVFSHPTPFLYSMRDRSAGRGMGRASPLVVAGGGLGLYALFGARSRKAHDHDPISQAKKEPQKKRDRKRQTLKFAQLLHLRKQKAKKNRAAPAEIRSDVAAASEDMTPK